MTWSSILPAFLASLVEFVEALTIVVVVGVTINWKSSLLGAGAAFLALAALVAVFGTTLVLFIPLDVLRLVIGIILILFGLQWLKKSALRFSGLKPLHDEAAIYEEELRELRARGEIHPHKFNGFGFATSFKSVLLEGLEVAFIVITFGIGAANAAGKAQGILAAALGALMAFVVVTLLGLTIQKPLTKIPENTLKFIVGVMLVTFGTFWAGEGIGVEWPLGDLFILALIAYYLLVSFALVRWLKPFASKNRKKALEKTRAPLKNPVLKALKSVFDFFCGDWRVFWGVGATVACTALLIRLLAGNAPGLPWFAMLLYVIGIPLSLYVALKKETHKKNFL
jgi:Ca2+/H+ antiporter, TMEM165/GDT1 family